MKTNIHFIMIAVCIILYSCGASKAKVDPYVGTWNIVIEDTPQGNIAAEMVISKVESNDYTCEVTSDVGTFTLSDMVLADSKLKGDFVVQGMELTLSGSFEGTQFNGFVAGEGLMFDAKGSKVLPTH